MTKVTIGSISTGTLRSEDLLASLTSTLDSLYGSTHPYSEEYYEGSDAALALHRQRVCQAAIALGEEGS